MISESASGPGGGNRASADDLDASASDTQPERLSRSESEVVGSDELALAARALFSLGRTFARQSVRELVGERSGRAIDLSRVLVAQAVYDEQDDAGSADRAGAVDETIAEVSVGTVAERLGIDPSTASRLVADAVRDGYLVRSPSAHDARRVRLTLTETGRALAEASRHYQRQVFLEATTGWSEAERAEFARHFVRFAEAVTGRYAEIADRSVGAAQEPRDTGAG